MPQKLMQDAGHKLLEIIEVEEEAQLVKQQLELQLELLQNFY